MDLNENFLKHFAKSWFYKVLMLFHGVHFDILTQLKITVNTFSIVGGTITCQSLRQTTTTSGGACVRVTGHREVHLLELSYLMD